MMGDRAKGILKTIAAILALVAAWQLLVKLRIWSPAIVPAPTSMINSIPEFITGSYAVGTLFTVARTLGAFALALPIGLFIGFHIGFAGRSGIKSGVLTDFLRSIPATALVPIFVIAFGDAAAVAAGAFSASLAIALATGISLKSLSTDRLDAFYFVHVPIKERIVKHYLPEIAGGLFIGLRSAMSLALILVIVAEMIGGVSDGLGKHIYDLQFSRHKDHLYAGILCAGILGWLLNFGLISAERRIVHWKGYA